MSRSKKPSYKHAPVRSATKLAEAINITEAQLDKLVGNASAMYRYCPQLKKDGSPRDTWDAYPQLKEVQELLNRRFLTQVEFPTYLQGGIRDRALPRDYVRHVGIHAGAACALALDIADFFPSITEAQVFGIWRDFFRFSEDVATKLARLTAKDGVLVQGAKTSNYLANLVFWRNEHELVAKLGAMGWRYSRLTDDITVSKKSRPSPGEESRVFAMAIGFIKSHGFALKRSKLATHRQGRRMLLNGLIANVKPSLPREERNRIRAQVKTLVQAVDGHDQVESTAVQSTLGKLGKLKRFHPNKAAALKATLPKGLAHVAAPQKKVR